MPKKIHVHYRRLSENSLLSTIYSGEFCGPLLYPEKPGTVVKIHQGTVITSPYEKLFEFIEEDRTARPCVPALSAAQAFPMVSEGVIHAKNGIFGVPAQEHFTDNGLEPPDTTVVFQIHAFEAAEVSKKGLQYAINFPFGRKKYIDHNIGKKCGNPFSTATGTGLTCETFVRAYL
jgi:hypothetical protein